MNRHISQVQFACRIDTKRGEKPEVQIYFRPPTSESLWKPANRNRLNEIQIKKCFCLKDYRFHQAKDMIMKFVRVLLALRESTIKKRDKFCRSVKKKIKRQKLFVETSRDEWVDIVRHFLKWTKLTRHLGYWNMLHVRLRFMRNSISLKLFLSEFYRRG